MSAPFPDLHHATIRQLQDRLTAGHFTSVHLVKAYISRIQEVNPVLNAVISISPAALRAARELDEERRQGKVRSILHGIPVAIKDNIATRVEDGMDTTAGSFALQGARVPGDADCVAKLREAGAIILCEAHGPCDTLGASQGHALFSINTALSSTAATEHAQLMCALSSLTGKTNLSVWANFRGVGTGFVNVIQFANNSTELELPDPGVQSVVTAPGDPQRSSCGSAVASAVGLAAVTLGTETGGSINYPASNCAGVGMRPTLGIVSQRGIVPITPLRDTAGPIARTVEDACLVLEVIAGREGAYTPSLSHGDLKGLKLLAPTNLVNWEGDPLLRYGQKQALETAYETLRGLGAEVIEAEVSERFVEVDRDEVLFSEPCEIEFVHELAKYLGSLTDVPSGVRTLQDVVQYTEDDPRESPKNYDAYRRFATALSRDSITSERYQHLKTRVDESKVLIAAELRKHSADAVVYLGATVRMWSHAAYPIVTVPLGVLSNDVPLIKRQLVNKAGQRMDGPMTLLVMHPNKPFGVSFAGDAFSDNILIRLAHVFEQRTQMQQNCKTYPEATPGTQINDIM